MQAIGGTGSYKWESLNSKVVRVGERDMIHSVKPGSLAAGSDPREHAAVDVDGDARHEVVGHAQHDRVRLLLRRARALDKILCSPTAV